MTSLTLFRSLLKSHRQCLVKTLPVSKSWQCFGRVTNLRLVSVTPGTIGRSMLIQRDLAICRSYSSEASPKEPSSKSVESKVPSGDSKQFENVLTIPNLLCVTRMCLTPVLAYLVVQGVYSTAFTVFVIAGITDLLDGWIARTFPGQSSLAGSFLDPMADKLLVGTLFLTLTYVDMIPVPLTLLIVARDVFLMMGGFYIRYISLPPPKTLTRYFDVTRATAQLAPTTISKVNTALQLLLIASTLASPLVSVDAETYLPFLWYATATTTVLSGLGYIFSKNTYRILRAPQSRK